MRHLQHIKCDCVDFHWMLAVVQSTDVSSFIIRPHVGDFKPIAEDIDSTAVEVQVLVRSTPRCFRDGIGDARTFEENFLAGLR